MALLASTKKTIEMMGSSTPIPFSETLISPDKFCAKYTRIPNKIKLIKIANRPKTNCNCLFLNWKIVINWNFIADMDWRVAPSNIQNDSWILSSYALIWGWVTNQVKWREMSSAIRSGNPIPKKNGISAWERVYWNQGSRRAYSGWKDVWDTILLQQMIANKNHYY